MFLCPGQEKKRGGGEEGGPPARYSSVVRAFAHGAMSHRIDPSWSGPIEHIKEPLLLIGKRSPCGGSRFPLSLSKCTLPYG